MAGIVSYGAYIPRYRIKVEEIARIWGEDPEDIKNGLLVYQKSVPGIDEDAATMAVEASRIALERRRIDPGKIGAIYVGSESHPYAVKPTATIVSEAICSDHRLTAADFEFACKAGTAALQVCLSLVKAGTVEMALAIGSDTSQGAPGDALEYTAAAGSAAFITGKERVIAEIEDTCSFTTDTPDFWRREGMPYPSHGGRFTGEPAYFRHVVEASRMLLEKLGRTPEDYDYAVFHQPNGKFPLRVAKILGFTEKQVKPGLLVPEIGNTYSASSLLGLCAVLDIASPGERIFMTSFGSGAGSDSFSIIVTDEIEELRDSRPKIEDYLRNVEYLDYGMYLKFRRKIRVI
ncbi:MAG: hydroxymethylglutaryl-CoA synthase [Archaeoglobi archaeon]|nr:hydroxymethylglutaryl-CoA synthase [Candidatus Mnemosynella bozhongmuii]MDI3502393.1 hydroxymethylglutaryl-CoA synthase [Archaeoglobi archaeon]MDK2782308.1 hydroxymethylglutaryl-CoA synthase [Archaeoglobi archaeon]